MNLLPGWLLEAWKKQWLILSRVEVQPYYCDRVWKKGLKVEGSGYAGMDYLWLDNLQMIMFHRSGPTRQTI